MHYVLKIKIITFELLLSRVQLSVLVLFDWPEMSQHLHELEEIDGISSPFLEKSVNNPIAQRIDGELGDAQQILST